MQKEIVERSRLLDEKGHLKQVGFSKKPLLDYNRKDVKAGIFKIKEWDYYLVYNNDFGVALTIADNAYMGLVSATYFDFKQPTQKTETVMSLLPMGRWKLPSSATTGGIKFSNNKIKVEFIHDGKNRRIKFNMMNFYKTTSLHVDVSLSEEPAESMVIATPFKDFPKGFYYNQKIIGMKATGSIRYRGSEYSFNKETSNAILDWGRGVWPRKCTWYWGAATGTLGGKPFGFNIGYGFGDTTATTENMIFYEGKAHKLENVTFHIPINEKGKEDYMKPWKFTSSDGRFEMDFVPILDRNSFTTALVVSSKQHQVFGRFSGKAILDDGKILEIKDFLGFAEKVKNVW